MIRRGLASILLLLLASCEPAFATTWTVTNDATLSAANAGAVAGDVVRIGAGTYTVGISPTHAGSAGSPIMYIGNQAAPTAATVAYIDFRERSTASATGSYISVRWLSVSGDVGASNPLSGGSYPYRGGDHDTLLKISTSASGATGINFNLTYSLIDSCTFAGSEKWLNVAIPANGTWKDYPTHPDAQYIHPKYNTIRNSTITWTSSASLQGASSGRKFLWIIRSDHNTFFNNTFNFTLTGGDGYFFASECYFSTYNTFQNNVWNYSASNRGAGTAGMIGYRDSSSFNRFVGNTLTATLNSNTNTTGISLSNDGTFRGSNRHNYIGFNTLRFSGSSNLGFTYQSWAFGDTIEGNAISTDNSPAFCFNKECDSVVVRHNSVLTTASGTICNLTKGVEIIGNRMASNVFYSTGNNGSGSSASVLVPGSGWAIGSLGVIFAPTGTAANAINFNGSTGAPASGANYGASGKSVWGSPRFQDSTSVASFDGHLRAGSYADNATGLTHIDGYAGAYAPGAATYFNITSSAGANGSISPNGTTAVVQGASQTYTMTPNTNYAVDSVYVDNVYAGALTSYSFTNVQATHDIRVVFKASVVNYTITASATNGAVISPNGVTTVASGGSQAYTISAITGYHVYDIQVDGSSVGTSSPYTFSNVSANHTIQATGAINTYTLTASAGANGSISPSGVTTVNYGASQTFTFTPNSGYHVSAVTVDGSGVGTPSSYAFTNVTANHTIAVTFAADAVTYTVTASANTGGSVTPGGATVWGAGTSPVYTIVPEDGYNLDDVKVDGVSVGAVTTYTFTSIAAPHTIAATFSVALTSYTITATTANGASVNPAGATLVGSGMSKTYTISTPAGTSPAVYVDGTYAGQLTTYTFSSVSTNHTLFVTAVSTGGVSPTEGCECYRLQ